MSDKDTSSSHTIFVRAKKGLFTMMKTCLNQVVYVVHFTEDVH